MARKQSGTRGKSGNASGRRAKNKIYTGGGQVPPKKKRHPRAKT